MNERIKELALQAEHSVNEVFVWHPTGPDREDVIREKFAELIVKECYETIKKDMELAHIQLVPLDFKMYANGRLRRIIKEHFGVEE
jgi:hypothetical protein